MQTRKTIVAGQFYPGQHDACIDEINDYLDAGTIGESLPETIVAGIVPHAGWTFSGSLAALVFSAIKLQHEKVHTFIIFGDPRPTDEAGNHLGRKYRPDHKTERAKENRLHRLNGFNPLRPELRLYADGRRSGCFAMGRYRQ